MQNSTLLFSMALGLHLPWQVEHISFSGEEGQPKELHISIGFLPGSRFTDESGTLCPVHDTVERKWQHLNFFEHRCFLHCPVPRIKKPDGKVVTVNVPWARPGSGFTLLFEAFVMALIEREMPVNRVAQTLGVLPQRIWTVLNHWVVNARQSDDPSSVHRLGIDETSTKKGHHYVTVGVDLDTSRVIHAYPLFWSSGVLRLRPPKFQPSWLSSRQLGHTGLALCISSKHTSRTAYWKGLIAKFSSPNDGREVIEILITSSI